MSTIRCVYHPRDGVRHRPEFPATDQHPDAQRFDIDHATLGPLCVDAIGGQPSIAEIDAVLLPSQDVRAALSIDAIDRLQFEVSFDMENRMRAQESLGAITRTQYRTALINRWKAMNP